MSPTRPEALAGVRIPSRNATVRRRVVDLYGVAPWLTRADLHAAVRWATLAETFRRLAERLEGEDPLTAKGDPRKAIGELRALSGELTKLEQALGITAAARASLGVNVGKMADLAALLAGRDEA